MKTNSLYLILAVIFVVVFGGLIALFAYANSGLSSPLATATSSDINLEYNYQKSGNWLEKIAEFKNNNSVLPTNLMIIKIDDKKIADNKPTKQYILIINRCDFYSMFCINRVFKDFNLNFTIVKDGDMANIYIQTDDKDMVLNAVNGLKKYNIHTTLKEINL
ncbi:MULTISPECIES: hypothetical protein [Campylobacter]|uniref:Periplasmic protein n=1 Tax=Campylobacter porcelli TaxID=1660073 RepID=A0ABU7M342_9BACT|nr:MULTISPECIES: hypothetical protein [unclassified Campylobacter]MCR8696388.1 hypothetical protein [Campylobacter sp. RM19073]MEE3704051.1 hypothetical protein [Campylobacter sp. CX2-8023-23]MEE3743698.1 hypothetical protein [Campylobacter sp. CX2-4855-23]